MEKPIVKRSIVLVSLIMTAYCLIDLPSVGADPTTMASPAPQPADIAAPKIGKDGNIEPRFEHLHQKFMQRKTEGPIDLLFLGDSITEMWGSKGRGKDLWEKTYAPMNAANFGIGGDQTQHVLWRIDQGELDGLSPKVLVLMIGTNNIGYPAEDILKADTKIVREIHEKLPETKILLLGIFPRGADPADPKTAEMRQKIATVNKGLALLDDGDKTRYLDIGNKFLTPDGRLTPEIMPDALHPSEEGYQIWVDAMNPLLTEMMK